MVSSEFIYFEDSWNNHDMNTEIHYIIKVLDAESYLTEKNKLTSDNFNALIFSSEFAALKYLESNNKLIKTNTNISFFEIVHYVVL